jgi:hypothetical protein
MKFSDIVLTLTIIIIFIAMFFINYLTIGLKDIKENWPKHRCSPMIMPFAGSLGFNAMENFTFCIANIQKNMMGHFLAPVSFNLSMIGGFGSSLMNALNKMRIMFSSLRNMITNIVGDIFGIVLNVVIQFQKLIIKLKDLIFKIIGSMTITIYMLQSAMHTGKSIYRGPIGNTLRTICFSPNTLVKTKKHGWVKMKNLNLGDILDNGSEVTATLKIKGDKDSPYYKIFSKELNDYIFVTGTHKIQDDITKRFIPVSQCKYATKTNKYDDVLSCLITDDHIIKIGEHIFWDWED